MAFCPTTSCPILPLPLTEALLCPSPHLQYVLAPSLEQVYTFISTLPIRKVPGVGKVRSAEWCQ